MFDMKNLKGTYTSFHKRNNSVHIYPTEWVVRTFLGRYPRLNLNEGRYKGSKILDIGFGDCRNMPLLNNCGFRVYGIEISQEIIDIAKDKLQRLQISATLEIGSNANIPFQNEFFDYLLACHSCYYVDEGSSFENNLAEFARVLRPDGVIVASLPAPGNFILQGSKPIGDGHVEITNDIFGLRNGYVFRSFVDERDVIDTFSKTFFDIKVCSCVDNFWGLQINFFIVVAKRK